MGGLSSRTLLVIGIHREELAFGEHVARQLNGFPIDILRVEAGLSNKKPLSNQLFYYHTRHRELYLQLRRHVKGQYRLLVDLHTGVNEDGCCVDVFCHSRALFGCLRQRLNPETQHCTRFVRIVKERDQLSDPLDPDDSMTRTLIPESIWASPLFCYVGLEVYLPRPGAGDPKDWRCARDLLMAIHQCAPAAESGFAEKGLGSSARFA